MATETPGEDEPPRLLTKMFLVKAVANAVDLSRHEAAHIVELIFDGIVHALRSGDKVEIRGFGTFRTRQRRGRIGRNPKTGQRVEVLPKQIPYFKPSTDLKQKLNPRF